MVSSCYGPLDTAKYAQALLFIARALVEKDYWELQRGGVTAGYGRTTAFGPGSLAPSGWRSISIAVQAICRSNSSACGSPRCYAKGRGQMLPPPSSCLLLDRQKLLKSAGQRPCFDHRLNYPHDTVAMLRPLTCAENHSRARQMA